MIEIPVIVDSHLRLDGNLIGHDLAEQIFDELTIPNMAKERERSMNRWGWEQLPDDFQLGELDGDTVVMPRGYALQLKTLLRQKRKRVQWIDRRQWTRGSAFHTNGMELKEHQWRAVYEIARHQQGMYEAPTGSGKTVTCIGFLRHRRPKWTLVLVDKLDLLHQWRKALALWLGCEIDEIGQIGDGKQILGERVTVATVQTLNSYRKDGALPEDFFEVWDAVIVDECHHVTAETIRNLVTSFNAKFRFGVSATTDRQDDKFDFALNVLGEVFWQDNEEELREAGVLMRPRVQVVRTNFYHPYWPDHESDEDDKCLVAGCQMSGKRPHQHRNNYMNLKKALIEDQARNRLVAETVAGELDRPHHHLVVSDEVQHLKALEEAVIATLPSLPMYVMTGQVKGKERVRIKAEIEAAPACIIFATVAKEGLDIPAVDRLYMPFPVNNPAKTQQWIGRGTRIHEGKTDIVVYDFFDINVDVFRKQFRSRRFKCYDKLQLEVDLGQ